MWYSILADRGQLLYPGVAKFGIALEWGSRGRWFESSHSDHWGSHGSLELQGFPVFLRFLFPFIFPYQPETL